MVRRIAAFPSVVLPLFLASCFPTSDNGTGGMDPVPCGGACVTTPEAPAAADNAPWGVYKAIQLGYEYTAAVRMFVGQTDPMTTSTCAGQTGSHELACSLTSTAYNDRYLYFGFTDDPELLWYPGAFSFSLNDDGSVVSNYMVRKESSTSLIQVFEGTYEGTKKAVCGALLQDGTLTMCCAAISQDLDAACIQTAVGSGALTATSCVADSQGHAAGPGPTTYGAGDTTFEGTLSGESLTGTWTNEAGSGTFELVRTM